MRGRGVRRLGALLAPLAVLAALLAPARASVTCTPTGTLDFSGAASPCAVAADLCTNCLTAIKAPMVTAGAPRRPVALTAERNC
jgi:type 1 fimbria pilin